MNKKTIFFTKKQLLFSSLLLLFTSCGTRDNQGGDTGEGFQSNGSENYTETEVRQILADVWAPVQHFYEAAGMGNPSQRPLPDSLDTPEEVRNALAQTMAPELASSFTEQLIWERNGAYQVRPTDRIRTIQHVDTDLVIQEENENRLIVAEQYPASELYGSQPRVNVLEKQAAGNWMLVEIR